MARAETCLTRGVLPRAALCRWSTKPPSATTEIPNTHRQYLLCEKIGPEARLTWGFAVILLTTVAVVISHDFRRAHGFPECAS